MEVINDLVGYKNLKIFQNTDWFKFSLDSVLLPNFVTITTKTKKILDLGTGNAPIPLILSTRTSTKILAVEIQKDIYELAKKTVDYNNLNSQIELLNIDMRDLVKMYDSDTFDLITCNPPYFRYDEKKSHINENEHKVIARHEKCINLEDIVLIAKKLLKNNGSLALVHRTDRLLDIIKIMNDNNIEIKKIQFVYSKPNIDAEMVLIEGRKNGNTGLKVLKPIYVYDENGLYTEDVDKIFNGE